MGFNGDVSDDGNDWLFDHLNKQLVKSLDMVDLEAPKLVCTHAFLCVHATKSTQKSFMANLKQRRRSEAIKKQTQLTSMWPSSGNALQSQTTL